MVGEPVAMIEVIYALPLRQYIQRVKWREEMTVRQALEESGLLRRISGLEIEQLKLGIYSRFVSLDSSVKPGDRVEIYRPLIADPKEVRKQRAAEGKVMKKGAGEQDDVAPLFVPEIQIIRRRPADRQDVGQAFDTAEGVGTFDAIRRLGGVEVPLLDARVHDGEELA